jgi:hypothetical protein
MLPVLCFTLRTAAGSHATDETVYSSELMQQDFAQQHGCRADETMDSGIAAFHAAVCCFNPKKTRWRTVDSMVP